MIGKYCPCFETVRLYCLSCYFSPAFSPNPLLFRKMKRHSLLLKHAGDAPSNQKVYTFSVLLQFSWRRGSKDSRVCFLKTLSALLTFFRFAAMSFFVVPNSLFSIKSKSPANNICVSNSQTDVMDDPRIQYPEEAQKDGVPISVSPSEFDDQE